MSVVRIGGVDLYSEVAGPEHGEPVLLLHGGFCSLESMRPQAEALAGSHRVFAFERPGHGRSADIDEEYSYARSLSDTLGYLDAHGLGAVHVVGYSDGAILGLLLAMRHPERVRSLVAISANLDPSAFTFSDSADPETAVMLAPARERAPEATEAPRTVVGDDPSPDPQPDAERMLYERLSPDGPAHADVVLAKLIRLWTTEPHIAPAELEAIAAPTLVMAGDRDTIRPDHTLRIAASIPGAQLCLVPGTTHSLIAERPALVTTLLQGFLSTP
ncbi:alpha/beta hydrolase [Herbiconiux sp.]|uniref:alpha/beta fold hydrolase n=1 Tax=Herbiconiux sp. TaxID=1871186 RepID=UPI0025BBD8BC|nr:alpha/beta hydrolase [Herbiconiux sp.]